MSNSCPHGRLDTPDIDLYCLLCERDQLRVKLAVAEEQLAILGTTDCTGFCETSRMAEQRAVAAEKRATEAEEFNKRDLSRGLAVFEQDQRRIVELMKHNYELRTALRRYGRHEHGCLIHIDFNSQKQLVECSCGLDSVLK